MRPQPDAITLDAAIYLMLRGYQVGWAPLDTLDVELWEVGAGYLSNDGLRAKAMSRGWVYAVESKTC